MSRRRRAKSHVNNNSTFAVNITSMTDMFTIMLVFLLQTYSTSEVTIQPEKGLELPVSNSETSPTPGIQVSITPQDLIFAERKIASLNGHDFEKTALDANDSNFVLPLFKALEDLTKTEKEIEENFKSGLSKKRPNQGILDGKIIVKADQKLPYSTIRKIMYTASMAGYPKLRMATVVGN